MVSLVVLALEVSAAGAIEEGSLHDLLDGFLVVLLFGAVPAAVIGSVGASVVHLLTRRCTSQWPAVASAGAFGLVVGLLVFRGDGEFGLMLGVAGAAGRLFVVPHARARGRRVSIGAAAEDGAL